MMLFYFGPCSVPAPSCPEQIQQPLTQTIMAWTNSPCSPWLATSAALWNSLTSAGWCRDWMNHCLNQSAGFLRWFCHSAAMCTALHQIILMETMEKLLSLCLYWYFLDSLVQSGCYGAPLCYRPVVRNKDLEDGQVLFLLQTNVSSHS